jgi:hypothetical protein
MIEILEQIIDDFHERKLPDLVLRDATAARIPGKANVVSGMRRSGKTWFCFQQMQELISFGLEKEQILYVNFEDERLLPFSYRDFQTVLETYFRKFPAFKDKQCHLFLDEVQRIEGWDKFVRRVLDTERLSVWVTGSSSKLLGSEIATALRGRSLNTEIFPFSFREFLRFHHVALPKTGRFGSKTRATLQHMADEYLRKGGFPEVQNLDDDLRRQVLTNYMDVVILRDVVERYSIHNTVVLRALLRHILGAPAGKFSINRFYNTLRSQGIACTKNNLYEYLDALTDAYLVYPIEFHSRSVKARQVNPRKVYVVDPGLLDASSVMMTADRGAFLENLVFMHLRRKGLLPGYYVTGSGKEVDFVLTEGERPAELIQVAWTMQHNAVAARELQALEEGLSELKLKHGTVVTFLEEDSSREDIKVVPVWKWLLT